MSLPAKLDLDIYQGDTFTRTFAYYSDEAGTVPIDLTGQTPKAQIRLKTGGNLVAEFVCSVTLPNYITITLPAVIATTVVNGVWDLQTVTAENVVRTYVAGKITVIPEVTTI